MDDDSIRRVSGPTLTFCTHCGALAGDDAKPCFMDQGHELVTKPAGRWFCIGCGQRPGKMHTAWCATRRTHKWSNS